MPNSISNTSGAPPVHGTDFAPQGLTAEGILAYCSSRLNSLDGLIQSRFADQKSRNDGVTAAGNLIAQLNTMTDISSGGSEANHKLMGVELAKLMNNTLDPSVRGKIGEAYAKVTGTTMVIGADGKAAPNQLSVATIPINMPGVPKMEAALWQGFVSGVKTVQDSLTKDGELAMIQLQSVVSQRQLCVQMTTQMMMTMNESSKQILSNLGR